MAESSSCQWCFFLLLSRNITIIEPKLWSTVTARYRTPNITIIWYNNVSATVESDADEDWQVGHVVKYLMVRLFTWSLRLPTEHINYSQDIVIIHTSPRQDNSYRFLVSESLVLLQTERVAPDEAVGIDWVVVTLDIHTAARDEEKSQLSSHTDYSHRVSPI